MNFLFLKNWHEVDIIDEKTHYLIKAVYKPTVIQACPSCCHIKYLQKYGIRNRVVKDSPVRGKAVTIFLSIQLYRCTCCNNVFADNVPELVASSRLTRRLIVYIIQRCIKNNFLAVSQETGVCESTVREVFTRFVENNQNLIAYRSPRVLGIDDVYIRRTARCVLTDIENRKVIELLPKIKTDVIYSFLCKFRKSGQPEIVTMDMHRPFYDVIINVFPESKIVIDTFHVQRYGNQVMSNFLKDVRRTLNLSQRRLRFRDRFLLLKRYFTLTSEEKEELKMWKSKWAELAEVYDQKEEFYAIWRIAKREEAETKYQGWKNNMSPFLKRFFGEIINMIENWYEQIFNYFDYRYTNAFTESSNGLIKRMQSEGRGYDFDTVRAKILFRYKIDLITEENIKIVSNQNSVPGLSRIERLRFTRECESQIQYFEE